MNIAEMLEPAQDWTAHPVVRWTLTSLYVGVLGLISMYGLHRYWLVLLFLRTRRALVRPQNYFAQPPTVTVQLPMYNEAEVAERVIDAACAMNYPAARLQVQVIDDSTDASSAIARARVNHWSARGVDIQYLHRRDRTGYKAGALACAMPEVKGEFIAIFDADFIPPANFLRRTVHYFTDEKVGMVQARWGHLNRDDSVLTRSQAIFLDGHFVVEHAARNRAGRWINFNGTAGMWRKSTIDDAGGWEHDTLTEDVDLSYRAQVKGWKFLFLPRVVCPAELPPEINAFKAQQHRWTKGSIQTALKLLPTLLRDPRATLGQKIEAFFHLTSPMVYLYVTLMVLLFYPAFYVTMHTPQAGTLGGLFWGLSLFGVGTASASAFYILSQSAQKRSIWETVLHIPFLMSLGIGIALNNARGCIEALLGHESPFVRTPKYNAGSPPRGADRPAGNGDATAVAPPRRRRGRVMGVIPTPSIKAWMSMLEIGLGIYTLECARLALGMKHPTISVPFLLLFSTGYLYVGMLSLTSQWANWRASRAMVPAASRG